MIPNFRRDSSFILNINSPIIVPDHEHPLIFCFVKEREALSKSWICNKCKLEIKKEQMIPTFYCTFCGYDLCQLCVGKYQLNDLKVFDSSMDNFKNISIPSKEEKIPWTNKNDNHKHELTLITRNNQNFYWRCDKCLRSFSYFDSSYYCSLCDYDLCTSCFNGESIPMMSNSMMNPTMNRMMNPMNNLDYFVNPFKYCLMRKPVIYLYPETPMNIRVQLNLKNSAFTVVYPKFNEENAWNVQASPNGDILINIKNIHIYFGKLNHIMNKK